MTTAQIDTDKLMAFVFRAVDEVGATLNCALVHMGDRLGYYRDLAAHGPTTPEELAARTGTGAAVRPRVAQRPGGRAVRRVRRRRRPLHAAAGARGGAGRRDQPGVPARLLPDRARHGARRRPGDRRRADATGGLGWHEHNGDVHEGCERFFRPGYAANLVSAWLPALDGVVDKLERGAARGRRGMRPRRLDGADGRGVPALDVRRLGLPRGVDRDRARAGGRGRGRASGRTFEVASATEFSGDGYDLVTMFDCLHDMGDPVGAARHVRSVIDPDGTWMIVEPAAGDNVEDNLNPVGRAYYGFSTLLCTPASLSQPVGAALGTQAGPARIRDVVTEAGFTRFRLAAQTPFNNVYEVRP